MARLAAAIVWFFAIGREVRMRAGASRSDAVAGSEFIDDRIRLD